MALANFCTPQFVWAMVALAALDQGETRLYTSGIVSRESQTLILNYRHVMDIEECRAGRKSDGTTRKKPEERDWASHAWRPCRSFFVWRAPLDLTRWDLHFHSLPLCPPVYTLPSASFYAFYCFSITLDYFV